MTPIISPMFIYLLSVIDNFKGILFCIGLFGSGILGMLIFFMMIDDNEIPKKIKTYFVASIICGLFNMFIPSKETLMVMYASKYITVDNIKLGKEAVVDTVKEIVDIINKEEE